MGCAFRAHRDVSKRRVKVAVRSVKVYGPSRSFDLAGCGERPWVDAPVRPPTPPWTNESGSITTGVIDPASTRSWGEHGRAGSLQIDVGAGLLEGRLGLVGVLLGDLLEDGLGGAVDKVLGLLEAELGELADDLDDLDLLRAGPGEDDVELVLLLGGGGGLAARGGASGGDGNGRRRGDVEALFEGLLQLDELEDGHPADGVEDLINGESHDLSTPC